jgi:hypothetical protein
MEWSTDRLIDETQRLAARGLARAEFFAELAPRLGNVIGNDASCWHTLDPHTCMLTSDALDGTAREATASSLTRGVVVANRVAHRRDVPSSQIGWSRVS